MTYEQALDYIHSVNWRGSRPGLSRITELLEKLGDPHKGLRCIHIAGTNGKGSTSAMLAGVLQSAGYRVGLFTSPYIEFFNERIMLDGKPIANDELAKMLEIVAPVADAMEDPPTEFELITALGFLYFQQKGCDLVVLEVGMGGRLDSTNVIESPLLSIITGIAIDHEGFLGNTVEAIAAEKAGIIKEGRPVLYGGELPSVEAVIQAKAEEKHAPFFKTNRSSLLVKEATVEGTVLDYDDLTDLYLPLCGLYQPRNFATVYTAVKLLRTLGLTIDEKALREGIAATRWKARFEVLSQKPLFVFDGSHNMQGIDAACEAIAHYFKGERVIFITGVMADKAYAEMAKKLLPFAASVYTVTPDNPRALSSGALAELYRSLGVAATPCDDIPTAVKMALREANDTGRTVVALGSLYMYGEVKAALREAMTFFA